MFTIIGVKLTSFTTKDGNKVTGYNVDTTGIVTGKQIGRAHV